MIFSIGKHIWKETKMGIAENEEIGLTGKGRDEEVGLLKQAGRNEEVGLLNIVKNLIVKGIKIGISKIFGKK